MFAVNHLGHFLLTQLLLPTLIASAKAENSASRLIIVSSEAHALFCKGMDFDDLNAEKSFGAFKTYGRSKLANLLMMQALVKQLNPEEVQVNALHPGAVHSGLGGNGSWYEPILKGLMRPFFISPLQGAATTLHLATADVSTQGEYYVKCKPHRMKPWAAEPSAVDSLWSYSERILQPG
jgi:NAD(P)-dependent dehydrogenase (short-subunit alcohol dehydrogenase family)